MFLVQESLVITHHEVPVLMVPISEACRESCKAKIFGFHFFSVFFVTCSLKTAYNLAIVHPTRNYFPPSCSSLDSASDDIVFITQSSNMATRMPEMVNDFETSSYSVL